MSDTLRVLLVEDSPTDAKLVVQALRGIGRPVEHERVQEAGAMRAALAGSTWDLVLSDWSMPRLDALAALQVLKQSGLDLPFIIVSGTIGEEAAADAMRAGAHDYVLKDKLARLVPAVERELRESRERALRRRAEEELRASEARFRRLWDSGIVFIAICDTSGNVIDVNEAGARMLGYTRDELLARGTVWREITPPEWRTADGEALAQLATRGTASSWEKEFLRKDGSRLPILSSAAMLEGSTVIGIAIDLTERKRAEAATRAEQSRFRALVENSADGVTLNTVDGCFAYVSPAAARIFGRSADELTGETILACVHPDDRAQAIDVMRRVRERPGASDTTVHRVLRNDGTCRWVETTRTNRLDDPAVAGVVCNVRDITDRKLAEEAVLVAQQRFTALFESGMIGILVSDPSGIIFEANETFLTMLGHTREDLTGGLLDWRALTPPEWQTWNSETSEELLRSGRAKPREKEYVRKDGTRVPVLVGLAKLEGRQVISVSVDLTERKLAEKTMAALEAQFRQAQKMEAVGRLAGGVAHDFNNVLSGILSYAEFLMGDLQASDPMRADVEEIQKAAKRAADLTRQLLMFSRQQVIAPKVINLNDVLSSMDKMLQRVLGEDVQLVSLAKSGVGRVLADPTGIEQIVMNLVVNARDAMPTGGKLTVETANVALDEEYAREHVEVKPGPYVMLAISDTGAGMDRATQARIFEPFFTTKEKGRGTGLGLSTVFGIVMQSGGSVWVYSEPGHGTTFKIYLPRVDAEVEAEEVAPAPAMLRGTETILLVEDEDQVRDIARSILVRNGYDVLTARNGGEALLTCETHASTIHLLLSDVVMPQMSGPELAKRLSDARPGMRVLCMSGYTDDSIVRHGVLDARFAFLQKPITPETLSRKVREVLDAPALPAGRVG